MSSTPTPEELQALLDGPALAPPLGVVPSLANPPNLRSTGMAVQIVCLALSTILLYMRMYTKIRIIRQVVLADYAILVGWAVFAGYFIPSWRISEIAPGVHQWDLRLKHLGSFLYYIHVGSVMYGICIFFIKLSILLQYLQIFVPTTKRSTMYWASHSLIWANFVFYFTSSFLEIFACTPISKVWDPLITTGHCINILALNVAASTINSISDIAILILPQLSIWKLQMLKKRKIQISALFLLGVFACVASVVRLAYAIKLYINTDLTYYTWLTGLWTYPEMAFGIIVACLPVSPKFFQMLGQTWLYSKIGASLNSLLNFTNRTSRRSTDNLSLTRRHTVLQGPIAHHTRERPKLYETLPDGQLLPGSSQGSVDRILVENGPNQSGSYIMRTIEINADSEMHVAQPGSRGG